MEAKRILEGSTKTDWAETNVYIISDLAKDGFTFKENEMMANALFHNTILPKLGDPHPDDSTLVCVDRQITEVLSADKVKLIVSYRKSLSEKPNLLDEWEIDWNTTSQSTEEKYDLEKKEIILKYLIKLPDDVTRPTTKPTTKRKPLGESLLESTAEGASKAGDPGAELRKIGTSKPERPYLSFSATGTGITLPFTTEDIGGYLRGVVGWVNSKPWMYKPARQWLCNGLIISTVEIKKQMRLQFSLQFSHREPCWDQYLTFLDKAGNIPIEVDSADEMYNKFLVPTNSRKITVPTIRGNGATIPVQYRQRDFSELFGKGT